MLGGNRTHNAAPGRKLSNATAASSVVAAVLILYPLSGGLLAWLENHGILEFDSLNSVAQTIILVYAAPLSWLYENVPLYQSFIDFCGGS